MDPITVLQSAKKVWDLAHLTGGSVIKNKAGGTYIAIQSATGNVLMSAAEQKDTIDEILVGIGGDIIQSIAITLIAGPVVSFRVSAASIITGEGLGNELKAYYKLIKSDDYEYWDYVQNWYDPNTESIRPYAKILMRKNSDGTYVPVEKAPGVIWSEEITAQIYNEFIDAQNAFYSSLDSTNLDTLIEETDGVLKVTLPDGTIYAQGDDAENTIIGGSKNDYLYGGDNDDILIGNGGGDYMEGGEGFDTYYTNDKDTIYDSDGKGEVYLNGILLVGGLFDESSGFYVSEDKSIEYQLVGNTLKVKNLVDGSELTVEGYIQKEQSLGINLANSLGKEVAIVIDTTGSMRSSIDIAKQQAAVIAGNIFKSNSLDGDGVFSKVSIVTFSDDNIKTIGTYYNQSSFQAGINKVNIEGGSYEYHCRALMEGMSNFTKDNGLDKQMFLITDEPGDDNERMGEVIAMANSFGSEMKLLSNLNSGESSYDNRVKINVISIGRNLTHLKRFSDETGGIFLETNSISELEDALFDVSNLGTMNDDIIFGNERDNILDGGAGDDLLYGGAGDDTYIFGYGYGNDLIHDYAYDVAGDSIDAGNDTVRFINGVTKDDLIVEGSGKDLIIKLKGSDDSLTIKGFYEEFSRVENFTFENGVALSADEIDELTKPNVTRGGFGNKVLYGTDRKDEIHGGVGRSEIYAKGGNDTIYSGIGNSYIDAGDGDDTIYGSVGKMVVRGGKGNDTMYGGIGNATYLFGKDDGDDLIVCGVGKSSILFDEEIEKESVFITSKDNNLFIQYSDEGSIVVKNHKRLKSISLNDGSYITSNDINRIIQEMNSFAASNDLDITNLNEMKNNDEFMQIVMSGWR